MIHLLVHNDDIIASTNNEKRLDDLMQRVGKDFEIKCLGTAKNYLGIRLDRDNDGNFLISQPMYIDSIVEAAKLKDAKTSRFPMDTGYHQGRRKIVKLKQRLPETNWDVALFVN